MMGLHNVLFGYFAKTQRKVDEARREFNDQPKYFFGGGIAWFEWMSFEELFQYLRHEVGQIVTSAERSNMVFAAMERIDAIDSMVERRINEVRTLIAKFKADNEPRQIAPEEQLCVVPNCGMSRKAPWERCAIHYGLPDNRNEIEEIKAGLQRPLKV